MKRKSLLLLLAVSLLILVVSILENTRRPSEPRIGTDPERPQPQAAATPATEIRANAHPGARISYSKSIDAAPFWAIHYGAEFWRTTTELPPPAPSSPGAGGPLTQNLNVGDVIARVSHAVVEDPSGQSGTTAGRGYEATFDRDGFHISISGSDSKPGTTDAS